VIVADTGAMIALIDRDDLHHRYFSRLFRADPTAWVVPWAVLPEVDYLLSRKLGERVERAFLDDVARGAFAVE
jgi:uncharacterized protein